MAKRSPLAPKRFPALPKVPGVELAAVAAGVRQKGRDDVMLAVLAKGTTVAGTLTRSKTAAAPVTWCQKALANGRARALLVNSGNANAFNGAAGEAAVRHSAKATAALLGCPQRDVFLASTGVIGEPLPAKRITAKLGALARGLGPKNWRAAADAIRTTDTFPKGATRSARIDGQDVVINGIAKGSGMIAPDMATMLAFIFTDAKLPADVLQAMLTPAVADSFNCITVDSDTSTSDTVLAFATGAGAQEKGAHDKVVSARDPRLKDFRAQLNDLCLDLAQQIVRDGEGASKFVSVTVSGAASAGAAKRIALSIANSPLVKTAIAGEDANWGRIVMAVGKAGERADRDKLAIRIGGVEVAAKGARHPRYRESKVAAHMKGAEIHIEVDVGVGRGKARVWTCDLGHGYVSINADYRT